MTARLIEETRALLGLFRRSDVRDIMVRTADCSIFFARADGSANPFVQARKTMTTERDAGAVVAPHLGTFKSTCPIGTEIAQGAEIGVIDVLDEARPIVADRSGRVLAVHAATGAFVEYGEPLVSIG